MFTRRSSFCSCREWRPMPHLSLQYLAHVMFQLHVLADFAVVSTAIVDVGAINSPINETDPGASSKSKARYFNSFAVKRTDEYYIEEFMRRLNSFAIPTLALFLVCCLLSAAALEHNKATTEAAFLSSGDARPVVSCLRVMALWFVVHPLGLVVAVLYLSARANGFFAPSFSLLILLVCQSLTVPRFMELYRLPIKESVFWCKKPLWARKNKTLP